MASGTYKKRVRMAKKQVNLDNLTYLAMAAPIMALPQLYLVWTGKAQGVSLITWATFLIVACIWLSYGIRHSLKPLIVLHSSWIIIDLAIVIGLLFHISL